jgi:hypothetical protein
MEPDVITVELDQTDCAVVLLALLALSAQNAATTEDRDEAWNSAGIHRLRMKIADAIGAQKCEAE